jgi:nicotinamidase-related amidase
MGTARGQALLLMDLQRWIVDRYGAAGPAFADRVNLAAQAARRVGMPVMWVGMRFRPGHPELSPNSRMFAAVRSGGGPDDDPDAWRIHPAFGVAPGDLSVTKLRVSAFAGSDLEILLRAAGIGHLVLGGIATSGVVLSTVRAAADLDYALTVLEDACLDADAEVHRVLVSKVFPRQADVVSVTDWIASLER